MVTSACRLCSCKLVTGQRIVTRSLCGNFYALRWDAPPRGRQSGPAPARQRASRAPHRSASGSRRLYSSAQGREGATWMGLLPPREGAAGATAPSAPTVCECGIGDYAVVCIPDSVRPHRMRSGDQRRMGATARRPPRVQPGRQSPIGERRRQLPMARRDAKLCPLRASHALAAPLSVDLVALPSAAEATAPPSAACPAATSASARCSASSRARAAFASSCWRFRASTWARAATGHASRG